MAVLEHALAPSRTHERRFYRLTELATAFADAYLVIQQGEVGPRGGLSKLDVNGYHVQEERIDPEEPPTVGYRIFLLAKDDPSDPAVYEVAVPVAKGAGRYYCSCPGRPWCKHRETFLHLVKVVHWRNACPGIG